jgi:hypothetical protein
MGWMSDPVVLGTAQWTLALLFALSSWSKLRDRAVFAATVADYHLVPDALTGPLATAIPFTEAVIAPALLFEGTRVTAAAWAAGLVLLFSLAVLVNLLRGRTYIDCGCFSGAFRQRIGWDVLARNGVLLGVIAWVGHSPEPSRAAHWLDMVTMAAAAGAVVLLFATWGALRKGAELSGRHDPSAPTHIAE